MVDLLLIRAPDDLLDEKGGELSRYALKQMREGPVLRIALGEPTAIDKIMTSGAKPKRRTDPPSETGSP